jgi:hypothetical protein
MLVTLSTPAVASIAAGRIGQLTVGETTMRSISSLQLLDEQLPGSGSHSSGFRHVFKSFAAGRKEMLASPLIAK